MSTQQQKQQQQLKTLLNQQTDRDKLVEAQGMVRTLNLAIDFMVTAGKINRNTFNEALKLADALTK